MRRLGLATVLLLAVGCGGTTATPIVIFVTPPPSGGASATASSVAPGSSVASTPGATVGHSTTAPTPTPTHAAVVTPNSQKDVELVEYGFSIDDGYINWTAVLHNPNTTTHIAESIDIQATFYDGDTIVKTDEDTISALLLDQTSASSGFDDIDGHPDRMEVRLGDPDWEEVDFTTGEFKFTDVKFKHDSIGDLVTSGTLESTFDEQQENVRLVAVYRDAAGKPLGADFDFVDFIDADAKIGFEINGLTNVKGVESVDVYWQL